MVVEGGGTHRGSDYLFSSSLLPSPPAPPLQLSTAQSSRRQRCLRLARGTACGGGGGGGGGVVVVVVVAVVVVVVLAW